MNILGIGTWEILIILVIILLVLGPDDLQKTGRTIGQWINKITKSEGWSAVSTISRELRGLPSRLAREAQLEDLKDQIDLEKQIGETPVFKTPEKKLTEDTKKNDAPETGAGTESTPTPKSEEKS